MKLIGLLVLLGLVSLVEGEVVDSFDSCPQFFVQDQNDKPVTPTVLGGAQYKKICQKYKKDYRYATLYDTRNRIPVYSAYKFTRYDKTDRKGSWMIEPQLDLERQSKDWTNMAEMTTEGSHTHKGIRGEHQALDIDYSEQGSKGKYQRGHLYPHCHNCDQDQAESTFTLTNAAPQTGENNIKWYNKVERITQFILDSCKPPANVVTGVVPGDEWIGYGGEKRVNVPSFFWSAVCCTFKGTSIHNTDGFAAGMEQYFKSEWKTVDKGMSVEDLNKLLSDLYGQPFKVFGEVCKK